MPPAMVHGGLKHGPDQGSLRLVVAAVLLFLAGSWCGRQVSTEDETALMRKVTQAKAAEARCRQSGGKPSPVRQELHEAGDSQARLLGDVDTCHASLNAADAAAKQQASASAAAEAERQEAEQVLEAAASGNSSRLVLYNRILGRLKAELGVKTKAELDALVERWTSLHEAYGRRGRRGFLQLSDQLLPSARALNVSLPQKVDFNATAIDAVQKNADGGWAVPSFAGVSGNRPVKYGVQTEAQPMVGTLFLQLRLLTKYAVCALGADVPNLMFPERYRQCADAEKCPPVGLTNLVVTPLVQWCHHCQPVHTLESFKLLCGNLSLRDAFFRKVFWRARSRIRFSDFYLSEAETVFRERILGPEAAVAREQGGGNASHVIGVLVPPPPPRGKRCEEVPVRAPFAQLEKMNPWRFKVRALSQPSDAAGCEPSWKTVFEEVRKRVMEQRKRKRPFKLYVSCVHCTADDWAAMDKAAADASSLLRGAVLRLSSDPQQHSKVYRKIVDATVLSWADELLIGRHDDMSLHVFEEFLLRKRFAPQHPLTLW